MQSNRVEHILSLTSIDIDIVGEFVSFFRAKDCKFSDFRMLCALIAMLSRTNYDPEQSRA